MLEWILHKYGEKFWTGCIWVRIGTSGGPLWTWLWTFGFYNMRGISWLVEWPL